MKKVLISVILASVATVSFAENRDEYRYRAFQNRDRNYELHHEHHGGYQQVNGGNWVAPLIIGGIAGAIIARESQPVYVPPAPVYIQQQPVYVQPAPVIRQQICGEWREVLTIDGRIYRERSCYTQ
jgi:hypothetical protein